LSDRPNSGGNPLEDVDARILQVLEAEPWPSVRTIAEFLKIPVSTVHLYLTISLNMKSRHFKWVPHFLDDDLRAKRLEGARQLLDVLQTQERCYFRDLITGDETPVSLDMKPRTLGFRLTQNCHSVSKGQLQTKIAWWSFSGEFAGSHTIAGSQKITH
jgi:hypothetical protein